jgi:hypothetical protein
LVYANTNPKRKRGILVLAKYPSLALRVSIGTSEATRDSLAYEAGS